MKLAAKVFGSCSGLIAMLCFWAAIVLPIGAGIPIFILGFLILMFGAHVLYYALQS